MGDEQDGVCPKCGDPDAWYPDMGRCDLCGYRQVETSDEACAVVCLLVSNPQDAMRKGDGWQRRVNDLIRALRDERNTFRNKLTVEQMQSRRLKAEIDTLIAENGKLTRTCLDRLAPPAT